MGTSADIGRLKPDGTYDYFHISYDGYLSSAGAKLFKHYLKPEALDGLFSMTGAPSLESRPDQMRDNHWFSGEIKGDPDGLTYLYRDGAWWFCQDEFRREKMLVSEGRGDSARMVMRDVDVHVGSEWVEITRELLTGGEYNHLKRPSDVEKYLDSVDPEPSVEERIRVDFDRAATENTNPNIKYFSGNGAYGISVSYP